MIIPKPTKSLSKSPLSCSRKRAANRRRRKAKSLDFSLLETRSLLTTFVVDTLADGAGADSDGMLSLREAIVAANTNAAFADAPAGEADGDIIRFFARDCSKPD